MDIRALNLFVHLAETLNFGQTSRICNITRSGLTRTIQRLENDVGELLFLRDNRSVTLTRAGELFREYALDVIRRHQTLKVQIAQEHFLKGELSIYSSVTAILSILPSLILQFRRDHPEVNLKLHTGDAALALPKLENGEVDITIAALPERVPARIQFLELLTTPLIFITPKQTDKLSWQFSGDNWHEVPIIMPERGLSKVRFEDWFKDKQMSPTIYSSVAGNEAMIAMVAMGCGIGVVPQLVLDNSPLRNRIKVLETAPALTPFSVGACTTNKFLKSPLVQAFWQVIKDTAVPLNQKSRNQIP